MHPDYVTAIETRLAWLGWGKRAGRRELMEQQGFNKIVDTYIEILEHGATFFMDDHFSALVDHARLSVPEDLAFDAKWLQAKSGWLYMQTPFVVPESQVQYDSRRYPGLFGHPIHRIVVRAVGWREVPTGAPLVTLSGEAHPAPAGSIQFCNYVEVDSAPGMFSPWTYFAIHDGALLGERVEQFERLSRESAPAVEYIPPERRRHDLFHEIRWTYVALHLMSQRLATRVRHYTDRATRRRAIARQQEAPEFVDVITLRRLEVARQRAGAGNVVDWRWQWEVEGHWRWQYFPSENRHRKVFIATYVKGPPDKPMKPGATKLFVARR